ncbi:MAG TPA: hypothetical protein VN770_08935 [Gaiellaceae bacterium]|nr:hypothetical protein [Gaiellaceae bacterium]
MRRLFTWFAGIAGGLAAYRALTRRRSVPEPAPEPDARAEELRERLARAHDAGDDAPVESAAPEEPDARRRAVHEQARSALDEMHGE